MPPSALTERMETYLDRLEKNIERGEQHIERIDTTLRELKTWKECFGTERLKAWHREANQHEERIRAIDTELGAVSGSIQSAIHAAASTRKQADASHDEAHARGNRGPTDPRTRGAMGIAHRGLANANG